MKKKYSKIFDSKNKAVSEVISTMLLIVITIVGGVTAFAIFNTALLTQPGDPEFESGAITNRAVKLMGFDTRDGQNLLNIALVDNSLPASASALTGGEFIVLKVRNINPNPVIIDIVNVNEASHVIDPTPPTTLSAVSDLPDEGEFNVVLLDSLTFLKPVIIPSGQDASIIISLEDELADITLTESIRILIGSPDFDSLQFLIPAGGLS